MKSALLTSGRQSWATPPELFNIVSAHYGPFDLDVCALTHTAKCISYYTPNDDGLSKSWTGVCWCNPPYNSILEWIKKGFNELQLKSCVRIVYLVTARPDTIAWQDYILPYASRVHFLRGRVRFIDPCTLNPAKDPAPFPSAIVVFNAPLVRKISDFCWPLEVAQ